MHLRSRCSMKDLYKLMSDHIHEYDHNPSATLVIIDKRLLGNGQDVVLACLADLLSIAHKVVDTTAWHSDEDDSDEDSGEQGN